ncbi:MAG: Jag N-terminal domain-containing protein [Coprothermobacterota bacterium]|nr:Jag N-terminal domain-containing protein [Coprothermobacterota bacterium]
MAEIISVDKSAKTVEEAIIAALEELGISRERALIEVLEEPKSGLFGIGSKHALVRVTRQVEEIEQIEEIKEIDQVEAVARALLARYDDTLRLSVEKKGESYLLDIVSPEPARFIGKHGETVNALQFILSLLLAKQGLHVRCLLDSGDYRSHRERTLKQMARRLADRVSRIRRPYTMPPLPPMERRVIHLALQDRTDVKTHSEGDEPYRKVIIEPGPSEGLAPRPPRQDRSSDDRPRRAYSPQQRAPRYGGGSERRPPDRDRSYDSGPRRPPGDRPTGPRPTEVRPPREERPREEDEPISIPSPMAPSKKWIAPAAPQGPYSPKASLRYRPSRKP